jgi:hypothetical protein
MLIADFFGKLIKLQIDEQIRAGWFHGPLGF